MINDQICTLYSFEFADTLRLIIDMQSPGDLVGNKDIFLSLKNGLSTIGIYDKASTNTVKVIMVIGQWSPKETIEKREYLHSRKYSKMV